MGEVYRALDSRVGREVAIKTSREQFGERFEREARAIAALNHPNICTLFDVGPNYLVMELVEGTTLAERIAEGTIPVEEALRIARQIADALEAAHDKGIVHRDLKPGNVILKADGSVKVLDFGLAKQTGSADTSAGQADSPTLSLAATQAGVILGTAAYMSPEQARGKSVDKRADIWAFGVLLYEMVTGRRLFQGEDLTETLASVVKVEPDLSAAPPRLRRLLAKCLAKDPRNRLRDIGDVWELLADEAQPAGSGGAAKPSMSRAIVALGAVAALVLAALTGFAAWTLKPSEPRPVTRWADQPPGLAQTNLRSVLTITRDGRQFAYAGTDGIYVRSMDADSASFVLRNEGGTTAFSPVFSPDGKWLAFWSSGDQQLKKVPVAGGAPVRLAAVAANPQGIAWDTDDSILYESGDSGIWRVPAAGGEPMLVVGPGDVVLIRYPQFLPGPNLLLATAVTGAGAGSDNVVVFSSSGQPTVLFPGSRARYLETGHIVYAQNDVLYAVPFDLDRLQPTGAASPLVESVQPNPSQYAVSESGTLVYLRGSGVTEATPSVLGWVDLKGTATRLAVPPMPYRHPRLSPDGRRVAAYTADASGESRIWVYDLDGKSQIQLLAGKGRNSRPIWTPDSQRLAFTSDREGTEAIWWQAADGSSPAVRLTMGEAGLPHWPDAFSPDGKTLAFTKYRAGEQQIWALSLDGDRALKLIAGGNATNQAGGLDFSPDGRWIAYRTNETNPPHIQLQPFPTTGVHYDTASAGGSYPMFSRDGTQLFYRRQVAGGAAEGQLALVDISRGAPRFTNERVLPVRGIRVFFGHRDYDISKDGKRLMVVLPEKEEAVVAAPPPQINVVLNWHEELRTRVPSR